MPMRWISFLIVSALFFLSQFYRSSNAVIAGHLLQDLHLDTSGLGTLSAVFFYAFAVTQIPISFWIDRVGAKKIMIILSLIGIIGAFIFSSATDMLWGMTGRVLLGIGMACNMVGTLKLLTIWFEARFFATLTGILFAVGYAGNIAATTPFVFLVQKIGWRLSYQSIAMANILCLILFFMIVKETDTPSVRRQTIGPAAPKVRFGDLGRLFSEKDFWIISASTAISYGVFAAIQTLWAGPYLMGVLKLSDMLAGKLILLINLGLILGGPAWGWFSDRIFTTRKWIVIFGHGILLLLFIGLAFLQLQAGMLVLVSLFIGLGLFRSSGMLMYSHIKERMPMSMAGRAMTGINFFTMIGPALFLQGIGILMQTLYPSAPRGPEAFQAAFLLCAACLLMAIVLYCFTKDTRAEVSPAMDKKMRLREDAHRTKE